MGKEELRWHLYNFDYSLPVICKQHGVNLFFLGVNEVLKCDSRILLACPRNNWANGVRGGGVSQF